jgi:hypothetical protein
VDYSLYIIFSFPLASVRKLKMIFHHYEDSRKRARERVSKQIERKMKIKVQKGERRRPLSFKTPHSLLSLSLVLTAAKGFGAASFTKTTNTHKV